MCHNHKGIFFATHQRKFKVSYSGNLQIVELVNVDISLKLKLESYSLAKEFIFHFLPSLSLLKILIWLVCFLLLNRAAYEANAAVAVINIGKTRCDEFVSLKINARCGEVGFLWFCLKLCCLMVCLLTVHRLLFRFFPEYLRWVALLYPASIEDVNSMITSSYQYKTLQRILGWVWQWTSISWCSFFQYPLHPKTCNLNLYI